MKKLSFLTIIFFGLAAVGVKQITSFPSVTTTERNALGGVSAGTVVLNTTTSQFERYNGATWDAMIGTPSGGVTTVSSIDTSPNANGLFISGANISTQTASASNIGMMTTGTQTLAGAKTFSTSLQSPIHQGNSANPASVGVFRLSNNESVSWRNAANNADFSLKLDSTNRYIFDANIIPNATGSLDLGSSSLKFNTLYTGGVRAGTFVSVSTAEVAGIRNGDSPPDGVVPTLSVLTTNLGSTLTMYTSNDATANSTATAQVAIETGNKTAGTGNSGDIFVRLGTSSGGTRGKLRIVDGSEGTAGNVWTSTDVNGRGHWAAPAAATRYVAEITGVNSGSCNIDHQYDGTWITATAWSQPSNTFCTLTVSGFSSLPDCSCLAIGAPYSGSVLPNCWLDASSTNTSLVVGSSDASGNLSWDFVISCQKP